MATSQSRTSEDTKVEFPLSSAVLDFFRFCVKSERVDVFYRSAISVREGEGR